MLVPLCCVLVAVCVLADDLVLDDNSFFLYNYKYHTAKLAQTGTRLDSVVTDENSQKKSHLWTLTPNPKYPDYYYISNEMYPDYRIMDFIDGGKHYVATTNNGHSSDMLFKFTPQTGKYEGLYVITNKANPNDKLTKESGYYRDIYFYWGPFYEECLWKLVPRVDAKATTNIVFEMDNRQASQPFTASVTITKGVKRSSTTTLQSKETYKASISASLAGLKGITPSVSLEFTRELTKSFSEYSEESWSTKHTFTFTVPAFKNFKVMQRQVTFMGHLQDDNCRLEGKYKIFESDTATFDDEEFIVGEVLKLGESD